MKANILIVALLGMSALSLASAKLGQTETRPAVVVNVNETGIVTVDAVNTALNRTWRSIRSSLIKSGKPAPRPFMAAPLDAFLDVDAVGHSFFPKFNVTLLSETAFQVTLTRKPITHPRVAYLASTTNGTNVTGIVTVVFPKRAWVKAAADEEGSEIASLNWNPRPAPRPKPFFTMVSKTIARNETTATVTVDDINGNTTRGSIKTAAFNSRPNLVTLTDAAASKWAFATVDFNETVSNTSFTVTLPTNYRKPVAWVSVAVTGINTANATTQGTVSVKITRTRK